jgi:hypothetical protein
VGSGCFDVRRRVALEHLRRITRFGVGRGTFAVKACRGAMAVTPNLPRPTPSSFAAFASRLYILPTV